MSEHDWDGIERRGCAIPKPTDDGKDNAFLQYIVVQLETVNAKLTAIHIDNINHKAETHTIKQDMEDIKRAFPKNDEGEADLEGHHNYHWHLVETSKSWKEIWVDVRKKLFGGIAWAIVVFVAYSIWEEIKRRARDGGN